MAEGEQSNGAGQSDTGPDVDKASSTPATAAAAARTEAQKPATIRVEVVYARPDRAWRVPLDLAPGATALQAYEASGLRAKIAELAEYEPDLGVFAHPVPPDRLLRDGDRVEVYRPLLIDPKDARRKRAAQQ